MSLIPWFKVETDENVIRLQVDPPSQESWSASIFWSEIIRICFKTGDFMDTDELYIFIKDRRPSYLIPIDGEGGIELWNTILARGLFDPKVAIELATTCNEMACFPAD